MYSFETPEESIIRYYKQKLSQRKISELTRCGFDRIRNAIQYYEQYGVVPSPKKMGRPTKSTDEVLSHISLMTIESRTSSCIQISKQLFNNFNLEVSKSSVQRYRNDLGFNYKPPKIKKFLNDAQIKSRIVFSNSILSYSLSKQINTANFIFSDESRFCRTKDGVWRWYRKNENTDDIYDKKNKFEQGIMVYGAIGYDYKSKLIVCEKTVDDIEYRRIINESQMEIELNSKYIPGSYIFQQDGSPAHTSFSTSLFLKKRFSFLKKWPANSPDLNPIEHLWGAIKRILKSETINSKQELIEKFKKYGKVFHNLQSIISYFLLRDD